MSTTTTTTTTTTRTRTRKPTLDITHPDLAAQIHPDSPIKAHEVTFGSAKKPLWVCENGHTWETAVHKRVHGHGCKTCYYTPTHRTLDITHPDLAAQIHPDSPIKAHEVTAGSEKEPLWVCENGHTWFAALRRRVRGQGCKTCYLASEHHTLDITHPELAAQIHPDSPFKASEVTAGSAKKPLWVCSEGHTWLATVYGRVRGRGCQTCYYTPTHRTLDVTHPELAAQIHPDSPFKASEVTAGSRNKALWVCSEGHTWLATVYGRVRGRGCQTCYFALTHRTLDVTHPELAKQIHPDSPFKANEVTAGSAKKPLWVCDEGHTWETTVANRVNGNACRTCHYSKPRPNKKTLNLTHPELAKQIHPDSPFKAHEVTAGSEKKLLWVCENGHTWLAQCRHRVSLNSSCPTCHYTPTHRTLGITHPELAAQIHPDSPLKAHEMTAGAKKKPLWVCEQGHTWVTAVKNRTKSNTGCPQCAGSQGEREVAQFVEENLPQGTVIRRNDRRAIKPLELDIYVPELRFAVEYNGTYWHSDAVIIPRCGITANEYHANKQRMCEEQGITLVFVDEEDWQTSREQCETRLAQLIKRTLTGRV